MAHRSPGPAISKSDGVMTANEEFVRERHPRAYVLFNADNGKFRVYADRPENEPLSETFDHASEAWASAARMIQEKEPLKP